LVRVEERRQWWTESDKSVTVHLPGLELDSMRLALRGRFQHANAALAACALSESGIEISPDSYRKGIEGATLPGRFEIVRVQYPTVVVDVAHNELAGHVLRDALVEEANGNRRPVIVVVGVSRNHDPAEILMPFLRGDGKRAINVVGLIATEPAFRPRNIQDVVEAAKGLGLGPIEMAGSVKEATYKALALSRRYEDPVVVVTGSFYTVGELTHDVWPELFERALKDSNSRR
jgi:dihydrofolate synthase/folylpolyglutamate synthase